jgi:hypothetical protein
VTSTIAGTLRIAAELLIIAVTVGAIVTGVMYALAAPDFDHPLPRRECLAKLRHRVGRALGPGRRRRWGPVAPGATERPWMRSLTPRPGSSPEQWQPFRRHVVTGARP